jgi:hypothetical protein
MVWLRLLGIFLFVLALASCGGDASPPQLVDDSKAAELPSKLDGLDDAVMTRTSVVPINSVDPDELRACGFAPASATASVVERVGVRGSSITYPGRGSALYACDKVREPATAEDPDRPYGGVWCGGTVGRFDDSTLNDPRLDICVDTDDALTAFAWISPHEEASWVVVSDAGTREVYDVAAGLPVRVTTTENVDPLGSASFDVEEYPADGSKLRAYTLDAQVAG